MTLNDFEIKNRGFLTDFFRDFRLRRTLRMMFAEITGDRLRQPAYEIKLMLLRVS